MFFMKIGLFFALVVLAGCSSSRKDNISIRGPAKVNDFYFEVLEIRTALHSQIIRGEPWNALKKESPSNWDLNQISEWINLRFPKEVERAKLQLLKSHLNTVDRKSVYTKDIEETCWTEVDRLIKAQLLKTAWVISQKANISPNRPLQEAVHDSIAANTNPSINH
jgi:hypothetical protein